MTSSKSSPKLTTRHLMTAFGVGHMTIFNWRHGTPTKKKLPHKLDAAGHVVFEVDAVKKWAMANGVSITTPLSEVLKGAPVPRTKPAVKEKETKKAKPRAAVKKVATKKAAAKTKPRVKKANGATKPTDEASASATEK